MKRAAIISPVRTPVGVFGKGLRSVPVEDLGATVVRAVVDRSGIDPDAIEDVVFGQSYANSETPSVGRWVALHAGLPIHTAGLQLDRRCGSGLQAIATAAMMVQTGAADVVLAGGAESMSNIEYYSTDMRWGARAGSVSMYDRLERGRERSQPVERFGYISGMIETAENLATRYSIAREDADAFSVRSHQRAGAIAAMAYGTVTIPAVDRIVGPGNAYVAEAKAQVASVTAIESPAGPSELLVIADDSATPMVIARELLAQAEHDPMAAVVLVSTSSVLLQDVGQCLAVLLPREPRADVIAAALSSRGALLLAASRDEAVAFANRWAPEHLLLAVRENNTN